MFSRFARGADRESWERLRPASVPAAVTSLTRFGLAAIVYRISHVSLPQTTDRMSSFLRARAANDLAFAAPVTRIRVLQKSDEPCTSPSADSITRCGILLYRFKKNDVVNDDDEDVGGHA